MTAKENRATWVLAGGAVSSHRNCLTRDGQEFISWWLDSPTRLGKLSKGLLHQEQALLPWWGQP
jgi:hypothetical protein